MVIRRIGVLSAAKIAAVIGAVAGVLAGVMFYLLGSLGGFASAASAGQSEADAAVGAFLTGMGLLSIVVLPVVYAIFGFIGGAIQAFLFNIAARVAGGLEVETQ